MVLEPCTYVSYYIVFYGLGGFGGDFLVYDRNVSFGKLNLSSSAGIGHLYLTPVMETKRVLSK